MAERGAAASIVRSYRQLYTEIETGRRAEHDLMPRLVQHLFVDALGFDETDYEQENDWNDIRLYDDEHNPVLLVEGKRRDVDIEEGIGQLFRYASDEPYARYLLVTNIDHLRLYRRCSETDADESRHGVHAERLADVNVEQIVAAFDTDNEAITPEAVEETLTLSQRQAVRQLLQIRQSELHDTARFDEFDVPDREDISTDAGFESLVETLSKCLEEYLLPYTLDAFDEYQSQYQRFRSRADDLESQIQRLRDGNHDESEIAEVEVELGNLRSEYEQYREFHSDYQTWVNLSQRQEANPEENKRIFCRESVYVQLNKILLIRIAEDQGLVDRMISNGGVSRYFDFWENYGQYTERDYSDLFEVAGEELGEVYDHLYTEQIFDWSLSDGARLDDVLQRTLWHLNHYDFSDVSRDVLGHLYEEHLDPQERKELGEFYTPTAVVDYILDEIGYTADQPLELDDYDLLDPACGSGTFLVRAVTRLRNRLDQKGIDAREALEIIQERIHGFDLNPFATHIAEMNLLFQVIDLYREVKADDETYTLDRFAVYQTDSLRRETQTSLATHGSDVLRHKYRAEKREADEAKRRTDYGFVVGNPPYVRAQNLPDGRRRETYDEYYSAYYNYDLYCLFVERAADWLADETANRRAGRLGFVLSNKFLQSRYGERLREFVPANYQLDTLVDFGSIDVFRSAKSFPLVFTATRLPRDGRDSTPTESSVPEYTFTVVDLSAETFPELLGESLRSWDEVDDDNGLGEGHAVSDTSEQHEGDTAAASDAETDTDSLPTIPEFLSAVTPASSGETPPERAETLAEFGIDTAELAEPPHEAFTVPSTMVADSDWRFVSEREEAAMTAIEEAGEPLATYCVDESVERGLRTGDNDTLVLDRATIETYDIESDLVEKLVGGQQVERWYSPWEDRYVLYTRNDTDLDDCPNARSYLESHRDSLEDRWCVSEGGEPWYAIDKTKSPELFERTKIVTPDIVLYNNFWLDESGECYCLNTTYQILSREPVSDWYLLGVLNSDVVQFYYRRIAPTYKDDFLRYISEYLEQIPIPDPETAPDDQVETVEQTARELQDRVADYHHAETVAEDPSVLYDEREITGETLSRAGYVDRLGLGDGDGEVDDVYADGTTVRLSVHDEIDCRTAAVAEQFARLIESFSPETVGELQSIPVPQTVPDLETFLDAYDETAGARSAIESAVTELESELNDAVYEVYGLDEDLCSFVDEEVETPTTPVRPKAMSDE